MHAGILLCAVSIAWGQSFEVASIKPAPISDGGPRRIGMRGGPGTSDPVRWRGENVSLANLITIAYDVQHFQVAGPSWLSDRFNIEAKLAEGTTKAQFRIMLQDLLVGRFGLKLHREKKEMAVYELVVAKNGPKLTESTPLQQSANDQPAARPDGPPKFTMGKDGHPEVPPGVPMMLIFGGRARRQAVHETMDAFAIALGSQLDRPVVDRTGLAGEYDFTLSWSVSSGPVPASLPVADGAVPAAADDTGPTIFTALPEQLGLRLESKKGSVEILVIDHVERARLPIRGHATRVAAHQHYIDRSAAGGLRRFLTGLHRKSLLVVGRNVGV